MGNEPNGLNQMGNEIKNLSMLIKSTCSDHILNDTGMLRKQQTLIDQLNLMIRFRYAFLQKSPESLHNSGSI